MSSHFMEALERELLLGPRAIPRPQKRSLKVAFVSSKSHSAPEEKRDLDFVDSIAKALDLQKSDYVLAQPLQVPAARLWIFFGDLPVSHVEADQLIRTESIPKLIETMSLKKELWLRLKDLKNSLLQGPSFLSRE